MYCDDVITLAAHKQINSLITRDVTTLRSAEQTSSQRPEIHPERQDVNAARGVQQSEGLKTNQNHNVPKPREEDHLASKCPTSILMG